MNTNKNIVSLIVVLLVVIAGVTYYGLKKTSQENTPQQNQNQNQNQNTKTNINLTAGPVVGSVKSSTLGEYLTDTKGRTLYVFADDKKLQSSCTGECLKNWPAFTYDNKDLKSFSDTLSKRMNAIKRADGTYQYAYGEKPVYYYIGDKNPGEVTGNGLNNGKWSIVTIE